MGSAATPIAIDGIKNLVRADGERRTVEYAATANIVPGIHLSILRDTTERTLMQMRSSRSTVGKHIQPNA